ncbi:phosphodiesterase [Roseobacteraceae bacterium S113]
MDKILIFTDLHIVEDGGDIIGLDPATRLAQGLAHAVTHHSDAKALFLTGDLTHHGRIAQYERLRDLLADLPWPITYMLGNHDDRANFLRVFPEVPIDEDGFVQTTATLGGYEIVCLDTLDPDSEPHHAGFLCDARLRWLDGKLGGSSGRKRLVLQHHAPGPVGFDGMDGICLLNGREELAILARHGIDHLIFGHIHRTISGRMHNVSFSALKSPCHQMPMVLGKGTAGLSVDEPGAYGIVLLAPAGAVVHTEDYALARHKAPQTDRHSEG